jgi:hypothetical protein
MSQELALTADSGTSALTVAIGAKRLSQRFPNIAIYEYKPY